MVQIVLSTLVGHVDAGWLDGLMNDPGPSRHMFTAQQVILQNPQSSKLTHATEASDYQAAVGLTHKAYKPSDQDLFHTIKFPRMHSSLLQSVGLAFWLLIFHF